MKRSACWKHYYLIHVLNKRSCIETEEDERQQSTASTSFRDHTDIHEIVHVHLVCEKNQTHCRAE